MIRLTRRQMEIDREAGIYRWERYAVLLATEVWLLNMIIGLLFPIAGIAGFAGQILVMYRVHRKEVDRFNAIYPSSERLRKLLAEIRAYPNPPPGKAFLKIRDLEDADD